MKRTLGPSWTAERIAAGERFKRGWMDFFGRVGAGHDCDKNSCVTTCVMVVVDASLRAST